MVRQCLQYIYLSSDMLSSRLETGYARNGIGNVRDKIKNAKNTMNIEIAKGKNK